MDPIAQLLANEQAAGMQIVGAGGPQVQQAPPGVLQRLMAGIPVSSIAASGSYVANINVSDPFRPDRIVLSTAAQALNVTNIQIGTKALNVSVANDPISGNCFAEDAIGTHLQGFTAAPGVGFKITFENPTTAAVSSGGGVFGPAVN